MSQKKFMNKNSSFVSRLMKLLATINHHLKLSQFESAELETLYGRYVIKQKRHRLIQLLWLNGLILLFLTTISYTFIKTAVIRVIFYTFFLITFFGMILLLNFKFKTDKIFHYVSIITTVSICLIPTVFESPTGLDSLIAWRSGGHSSPTDGLWLLLWTIFTIYSMLPFQLTLCFLCATLISFVHLLLVGLFGSTERGDRLWLQVIKEEFYSFPYSVFKSQR